jgi:hypothetical protein
MMMTMPFPIAVSARRLPEEEDGVAVAAVIIGHGHACSTACSMRHAVTLKKSCKIMLDQNPFIRCQNIHFNYYLHTSKHKPKEQNLNVEADRRSEDQIVQIVQRSRSEDHYTFAPLL